MDTNHCIPVLDTLDGQEVLRIVEKMSEFEGGMDKLYKWFGKNVAISRELRRMGGRFFCTFVIDTLGQMRNFCVTKPNDFIIESKSIEELNQKKWEAGENKGKKVYVRLMMSISIRMD